MTTFLKTAFTSASPRSQGAPAPSPRPLPASNHRQCWHWRWPSGLSPRVPPQLTLRPGSPEDPPSEKLPFTSNHLCAARVSLNTFREPLGRGRVLTYIFQRSWQLLQGERVTGAEWMLGVQGGATSSPSGEKERGSTQMGGSNNKQKSRTPSWQRTHS